MSARDIVDEVNPKADTMSEDAKTGLSMITACAAQPFIVGRTLMQVGYEPVGPFPGRSLLLRKPKLYYPNTYSYLWHLRKAEGLGAMFTGLTPKMMNVLISRLIERAIESSIRTLFPYRGPDAEEPIQRKGWVGSIYEVSVECMSKSAVIVITQPFQVVMVRMICSIISKDEVYQGLMSTVKEIYNTEGVAGFFSGIVPRWISEVSTIVATGSLMYGVYRLVENTMDEQMNAGPNYQALVQQQGLFRGFFIYGLVYKYQLASTVMAASCKGLQIGIPQYDNWRSCFSDLSLNNQLARGQSMFYREALRHVS